MSALELPPQPWIVGHRGVRGPVPENTVASLLEAVAQGADMVELDLQLSCDGHLVVFHDARLPAPAGRPEALARPVAELTLEEIRRHRPLRTGPRGERSHEIPTLAEILAAAPADLPLNLEIKRRATDRQPAALVAALAETLGDRGRILVSSFDGETLLAVRRRMPGLPVAPLGGETADWDRLIELAGRLGAFSLHLHRRLLAALARDGRLDAPAARRLPLLAYTVNRFVEARALRRAGVAGFFTDRPAALRAGLGAPS